jgi:hypothetical protein
LVDNHEIRQIVPYMSVLRMNILFLHLMRYSGFR